MTPSSASPVSDGSGPFTARGSLITWLTAALLWVCAAYFLVRMRGATLPDGEALRAARSDTKQVVTSHA
jgi:hypothetical protein